MKFKMNARASIRSFITHLYFIKAFVYLLRGLFHKLSVSHENKHIHHDTNYSKMQYDKYGERELIAYENGHVRALYYGSLTKMTFRDVRHLYMENVYKVILAELEKGASKVKVLEVGCGNATNLKLIKERFGGEVELFGIDISLERIKTGKAYWGEALTGIDISQADATNLDIYESSSFDIVYSVCALEQITYRLHEAISEMIRVSKNSIVCIEPVFEFGNRTQRLYNIVHDQCRTLLLELRSSGLEICEGGVLGVLHNPLNPVGVITAKK